MDDKGDIAREPAASECRVLAFRGPKECGAGLRSSQAFVRRLGWQVFFVMARSPRPIAPVRATHDEHQT